MTSTTSALDLGRSQIGATAMHSMRWYQHQKEMALDERAINPPFLPIGSQRLDASTMSVGKYLNGSHIPLHKTLFERKLPPRPTAPTHSGHSYGFFSPEHNSQTQKMRLQADRKRFEPLRCHTGTGGRVGPAAVRAQITRSTPPVQHTPPTGYAQWSPLRITPAIPVSASWHTLPRYPRE